MARLGRAFEVAVYEFYKALDPSAEVLFDHRVPDRQTGTLRQVDVWVTWALGGHIPMAVLISCKDHARPLDITAVESLLAEMHSTGANAGVLYGRSGFTKNAIEKARANGVCCCRLFENASPEMPTELLLEAFVAQPQHILRAEAIGPDAPLDLRWSDVMQEPMTVGEQRMPLPEVIAQACRAMVEHSDASRGRDTAGNGPEDDLQSLELRATGLHPSICLSFALIWHWHVGELNAFRLTGSMELPHGAFKGTASISPLPVNTGPMPSMWTSCQRPPPAGNRLRFVLTQLAAPTAKIVVAAMAHDRVFCGKPWVFGPPPAIELSNLLLPGTSGPLGMQITTQITRKPTGW